MSYGRIYSCSSFWTVKGKQEYMFCCLKAKSGNSILRMFFVKHFLSRNSINTSLPEGVMVLKVLSSKKRHKKFPLSLLTCSSHLSFGNFVSLFTDNTPVMGTSLSDGLNGTDRRPRWVVLQRGLRRQVGNRTANNISSDSWSSPTA